MGPCAPVKVLESHQASTSVDRDPQSKNRVKATGRARDRNHRKRTREQAPEPHTQRAGGYLRTGDRNGPKPTEQRGITIR